MTGMSRERRTGGAGVAVRVTGRRSRLGGAALVVVLAAVGAGTVATTSPAVPVAGAVDAGAAGAVSRVTNADQALDRPAVGASAEGNGGYDPGMPTDPAVLGRWLDELRARGVAPQRYSTLLAQYWLTVATRKAGLEPDRWDPSLGLAANVGNLEKTFAYYCRLGLETPEFLWAGQGGLAGPSFAAGIMDVDLSRVVLDARLARDAVAGSLGSLHGASAPHLPGLPADVHALLDVGDDLTTADVDHFQRGVIAMSKHIFIDLIPQHEAYLAGDLPALEEYRAAGLIDDRTMAAWRAIAGGVATGDRDAIVRGNLELLHREQYDVIGAQWDAVASYRYPVGRALTYLSTLAADPAIPGLRPPREVAGLVVEAGDVGSAAGPGSGVGPGAGWRVRTPLTTFNWADRDGRWTYIEEQMAPAYRHLRYHDEPRWHVVMSRPVQLRIADQRAVARLPQMLVSMAGATGSA